MNSDREFVDRVRSAADIARTVGEVLPLRRAGRRLAGLCPFHAEKTPSFYVDEQKQLFHCFGCGVGGDVFKFVMLHEKMEFRETLEMLAEKNGIEVPKMSRQAIVAKGLKDRLYEANAVAAAWFRAALANPTAGKPGRDYLAARGVRAETLERLGLGFAPREWESLKRHLVAKGFTPEEILASGLVVPRQDGSGSYDRFRERIIFPIVSAMGKIVGFGGRTIGPASESAGKPKYMNSPESPIYSKSEVLYGLYPAREALGRDKIAVLVEGYLDFASLFEAGIENVVASLGTAFTEGHAKLLARYVDGVVVNYDPDTAGRAATLRSLAPLVAKGLRVRVLRTPQGEDPDALVRRIGPDAYRELLRAAPDYMDYAIEEAVAGKDLSAPRSKVAALNEILPLLGAIESPIERSRYVPVLADRLAVEDALVLNEISKAAKERRTEIAPPPPRESGPSPKMAEIGLVRVLVEIPHARAELTPMLAPERHDALLTWPILSAIREMAGAGETITYPSLIDKLRGQTSERLVPLIAERNDPLGDLAHARDCLDTLELDALQAECRRIQRKIEATADGSQHAALVARKFELSQRIRDLS